MSLGFPVTFRFPLPNAWTSSELLAYKISTMTIDDKFDLMSKPLDPENEVTNKKGPFCVAGLIFKTNSFQSSSEITLDYFKVFRVLNSFGKRSTSSGEGNMTIIDL